MKYSISQSLRRLSLLSLLCLGGLPAIANCAQPAPPAGPCFDFNFERPGITATSQIQSAIASADINRDGIPDAVVTIPDLDFVSIYLGNNDGTFQTERNFLAGDSPAGIAIADLNRDGELDLAITSLNQAVNILFGDGDGNFGPSSPYPVAGTGGSIIKVAAADLDNDLWPDLAVVNSNGLRILFGSSTGFATGPTFSTPMPATNVAVGNFNNDSFSDLVVTYAGASFDGGLRVYLNNGQSGFTEGLTVSDSTVMRSVLVKDFTNDGKSDIVAGGYTSSSSISPKLIILAGNGDGTFQALPPGNAPTFGDMASADFNTDGKLDLVTSYGSVYLGNGAGAFNFSDALYPIIFPNGVASADFNGDGILDLIQSNGWRSRLYTYAGYGDGRFPTPSSLPSTSVTRNDSAVADFNADGRKDVVTMEANGTVYLSLQTADGSFQLVGDGAIFYSGTSTVTNSNTIEAADFNNDGKPDIAFTVAVFNTVRVLLNNGNGTFTNIGVGLGFPSQRPEALRVGDFNNDNNKDIAVLNRDSSNYTIVMGDGMGGFTVRAEQQSILSGTFTFLAVSDIDLDGKQDLLVSRGNNNLYLFRGAGDGTFLPSQTIAVPRPVGSILVTDFNSDNLPDIGVASGNFTTSYFVRLLNNGSGGFTTLEYPAPGMSSDSIALVTADFDRDGAKDVIISGPGFPLNSAGILRGDGTGNFDPAVPFENFGGKAFSAADFNNDGIADYAGIGAVYINKAIGPTCLNIGDATATETNSGTQNLDFTVTLSAAASETVTVNYKLVGRSAAAGEDFDNVTGMVTFEPGMLSRTISVPIRGDLLDEADEIFNVQLFGAVNASLKDGQGAGMILDNDIAPDAAIGDAAIAEGNDGTSYLNLNVALTAASGRLVKVTYATQAGTATPGSDYAAVNGILLIEPGVTSKPIKVPINSDTLVEPDESFTVTLSNPVFVNITDGVATGTILNDDIGGNVQFSSATYSVTENGGSATITITRAGGNASNIVANYSTANGTATAGQDYTATSGSVVFGANESSKTFVIPIINDSLQEPDVETVNLSITGITGGASPGTPITSVLNIMDDDGLRPFDFDGDGKTDIGIFRPAGSASEWWINRSSTGLTFALQFGASTDKITPADYTGDGKADIAFFRPASGEWYVLRSEDFSFFALPFGTNGDVPVPADYDADGKADFAVFRPSSSTWFISQSSGAPTRIVQFGIAGDQPVVSDYDGDGKADIAIFRNAAGAAQWWIERSTAGSLALQFGASTDKAVQGDYTGDGKTDVAIWRPSTGEWFIVRSEDSSFYGFPFGANSDVPAPGDYDGDGKFDATVFRQSSATWFIARSTAGTQIVQFGASGDRPIPNAFVP